MKLWNLMAVTTISGLMTAGCASKADLEPAAEADPNPAQAANRVRTTTMRAPRSVFIAISLLRLESN